MAALLHQFAAEGVRIEAAADGNLRVTGRLTDALRASIRANKPALLAELAADSERYAHARLWRIRYPDAATMDVLFTPAAMAEEVREIYPGATIEAIPEPRKRLPTPAEAEELRTMVAEVLRDDSEGCGPTRSHWPVPIRTPRSCRYERCATNCGNTRSG